MMHETRRRVLTKHPPVVRTGTPAAARRVPFVYHQFIYARSINVIICEPVPCEYVWMCVVLRPGLRNRRFCKELVRYILFELSGRHHVHFFAEITSLRQLAREDGWKRQGKSKLFTGCVAYLARRPRREPPSAPLLRGLLEHRVGRRRPTLPTFRNVESARRAIRRIQRLFVPTAVSPHHKSVGTSRKRVARRAVTR